MAGQKMTREQRNAQTKARNAARKNLRKSNPKYRGSKLRCWPLPT